MMLLRETSPTPPKHTEAGLRINGLNVRYPGAPNGRFTVWDVSLNLEPGTIVGLAGESGCGKSTTAKAAIGFQQANEEVMIGNDPVVDRGDVTGADRHCAKHSYGREQ